MDSEHRSGLLCASRGSERNRFRGFCHLQHRPKHFSVERRLRRSHFNDFWTNHHAKLCGANAEELFIPGADQATPYAVYFSINNGDFDSWYIDAVNVGNDVLGWGILDGNNCDDFTYLAGAAATDRLRSRCLALFSLRTVRTPTL